MLIHAVDLPPPPLPPFEKFLQTSLPDDGDCHDPSLGMVKTDSVE